MPEDVWFSRISRACGARPRARAWSAAALAVLLAWSGMYVPRTPAAWPPPGAQAAGGEAHPARRVISLVPAVTEMLFAIGAGRQVVAVSSFDDVPPEVQSLPRVGALLDPDMERILALEPDLVVIYGSQTDLRAQLARAGIRAFSYRHGGIDHMFATIGDLGRMTGHESGARRLARDIRDRLDAVRARVRGRATPRTLLVFGRDRGAVRGVYASGGVGFLHEMLQIAGGVNVFADVRRESVQPSVETLLARAPEVILELRATGLLEGDHLVVPGPRIASGVEAMARALHPAAFP